MKVILGKKLTAKILLDVAEVYLDSALDEYHKDTHYTGLVLVELAKRYLK